MPLKMVPCPRAGSDGKTAGMNLCSLLAATRCKTDGKKDALLSTCSVFKQLNSLFPGSKSQFLRCNNNNKAETPLGMRHLQCSRSQGWRQLFVGRWGLRGRVLAHKPGLTVCVLAGKLLGYIRGGLQRMECLPDVQAGGSRGGWVHHAALLNKSNAKSITEHPGLPGANSLFLQFLSQSFSFPRIQQKWSLKADLLLLLHPKLEPSLGTSECHRPSAHSASTALGEVPGTAASGRTCGEQSAREKRVLRLRRSLWVIYNSSTGALGGKKHLEMVLGWFALGCVAAP